ncbi:hypothetical protein SRHO_G00080450 [Serrasalmus rhombeus]
METEPGEAENKALDPGEPAAIRTSPVPEGSQGLEAEIFSHKHQQETSSDLEKLQENSGSDKEKDTVGEKEAKEGMEKEDEIEKEVVVDEEEGQDTDSHHVAGGMGDEYNEPYNDGTTSQYISTSENLESNHEGRQKLTKTPSFGKTVRFSETEDVEERDSSEESLFPDYDLEEWTVTCFEELFMAEDWMDITDDRLLRKKILEPGPEQAPCPVWGQEVMLKMQGVLEDRTMVEKDSKLVFVIGEGDVNQALEECAISMRKGEIALLLADSQYTYGLLGR